MPQVTGYKFGTVEVRKVGWRKWDYVVKSIVNGSVIDSGTLWNLTKEGAQEWAESRWADLEFLGKLQSALNSGKVTPTEYYQILAKYEADKNECNRPSKHTGVNCKYHQH